LDNAVPVPIQTVDVRRAHRSHALMHLLMLVATFCWAGNIIAAKHALTGFSAMALASLRIAGAALLFALLSSRAASPWDFV
jgi:drug/metabolite transporter (DMT)-like permease